MSFHDWSEVVDVFHQVLSHPVEDRTIFLSSMCCDEAVIEEVRRLLDHHHNAGNFLEEPAWAGLAQFTSKALQNHSPFSSTDRFVVQERLGEGAFGIVYRVFDRDRNSMVALKALRNLDAVSLTRFKHEFRSLVGLAHPNLVQLYELFGEGQLWFFTMELVEGKDFLSYTRPHNIAPDWDRLREALAQLTAGVQALHTSARLHRDLKPSNVLVSNDGRVLILDFGLVKDLEGLSAEQSVSLAGSPAYMAPEQIGKGKITYAADWYAVGVMLYRALTGVLPFQGDWQQMLSQKQDGHPPDPILINPDVPQDLNVICHNLLQQNPSLRADGVAVLTGLQRRSTRPTLRKQNLFVGRLLELELLERRFRLMETAGRQVVLIQGRSGIGKSTLIAEFIHRAKLERPETVVLRGRCRESESVPFKALDSVADQLAQYLHALTEASAAALLPRHPALLARMFPCFDQLGLIARFPDQTDLLLDDQEMRQRAFAAFCETLDRIADRQPLIISIDDLQWGDLDSVALLAEVVIPVQAPRLMLVLAFRSEDGDTSPPVRLFRTYHTRLPKPQCWTEISLAGLREEDGRDLLRGLDRDHLLVENQLQEMVEESRGSPLFLKELLQTTLQDYALNDPRQSNVGVSVAEMILRRTHALSPIGRELFEALSVAVEPLSRAMLCRTLKAPDGELSRQINLLVQENLIRVTGGSAAGRLEPFHDQFREALLTSLHPENLKNWHRRLAETLEADGMVDPQRLLQHYIGAGDKAAVYRSACAAAQIAVKALAFDRAASFYLTAIGTGHADAISLATLHRQRAQTLAKAGRGKEAAAEYLLAAWAPEHNDVFQMRRLAAEQLMRSGYMDEGLEAFMGLLRSVGFWMPATPLQSILAMLAIRALLRLRGLRWLPPRKVNVSSAKLRKLDLLWSGASVFLIVNPVFGTYLQARHMLGAVIAGEPVRLALSLGHGASYESLGGVPDFPIGNRLLLLAEGIASKLQDSELTSALVVDRLILDFLCGRIEQGLEQSRRAIQMHCQLGFEQTLEGSTAKLGLIWFLGWSGNIREMSQELPGILEEARSRGDIYTFVVIRCMCLAHLADLAADNPDHALEETRQALGQWSQARYDSPRLGAAIAVVECHLYAGSIEEARKRVLAEWPVMMRSLLSRKCQWFQIILFYMRARTSLASWLLQSSDKVLLKETESHISKLRKIRSPMGTALGDALQSSLKSGRGYSTEAIILLDKAESLLRQQGLLLLAAAVSRRRGELEGKDGAARVHAAEAFMKSEGIVRPDRMTFMLLPN